MSRVHALRCAAGVPRRGAVGVLRRLRHHPDPRRCAAWHGGAAWQPLRCCICPAMMGSLRRSLQPAQVACAWQCTGSWLHARSAYVAIPSACAALHAGGLADRYGGKLVLASGVACECGSSVRWQARDVASTVQVATLIQRHACLQGRSGAAAGTAHWQGACRHCAAHRECACILSTVPASPLTPLPLPLLPASPSGACLAAVWSLFTFLTPAAAASSTFGLLLARVMLGVGEGVAFPSIHSLISRNVPADKQTTAVGIVTAASYAGTALAFGVSPLIISQLGWEVSCGPGHCIRWSARACAGAAPLVLPCSVFGSGR